MAVADKQQQRVGTRPGIRETAPITNRQFPFRLLASLSFGSFPYLTVGPSMGQMHLRSPSAFSRLFHVPSARVLKGLAWLNEFGYIRDLRRWKVGNHIEVSFYLTFPPNLYPRREGQADIREQLIGAGHE